ncbi:hypothetical protein O4H49_03220 [Kiloniella laminariae]|uniref:Uncharacterized protein n=1 Tax=Kiloniella laminariae TaxID=454162 RepID=A0ABT4LFB6_9PROT|nr:hypothetical protein [Kiloniella laminariae]MCZ4279774.1 hypothetical protein [Kiloniella laminariae]
MKSTPTLLLRLVLAFYCVIIGYLLYSGLHALLTLAVRDAFVTGQTAGQSQPDIAAFFAVFSLDDLWVVPGSFIAGFLVFPAYTSARAYKPGRAIWGGVLTCGLAAFLLLLIQLVLLPHFESGYMNEAFLSTLGENLVPPALYALLFAPLGAPLGWLVNKLVYGTGSRSQYWS